MAESSRLAALSLLPGKEAHFNKSYAGHALVGKTSIVAIWVIFAFVEKHQTTGLLWLIPVEKVAQIEVKLSFIPILSWLVTSAQSAHGQLDNFYAELI